MNRLILIFFSLIFSAALFSATLFAAALFNPQPGSAFKPSSYSGTYNTFRTAGSIEAKVQQYAGRSCERSYDEYLCMMCNCMRESAGEPLEGKKLVGLVVKSRVEDSRWPNDICGVIYEDKQFSWTIHHRDRRALPRGSSQSMRECVVATDATINAPGNGWDHYHADYVRPGWARRCQVTQKVGRHIFYDNCTSERGRGRTHPIRTRSTR